jgi:hypothetical protein
MYEFIAGFIIGLGTIWIPKSPKRDAECQVEPSPPSKPVAIQGPARQRLKGIPELAHFWD